MKKPDKPYKEFPLYAHASGQWIKRIKGKIWYFGVWSDPDGAIEKYKREIDDIMAGRDPRRMAISTPDDSIQLVDLVNTFLTSKRNMVNAGRLSNKMFSQYHAACKVMIEHFGKTVAVSALSPRDFSALIASFPKTWGLEMIGGNISRIRSVFLFGLESDMISSPVKFGPDFKRPKRAEKRRERAGKVAERGRLSFEASEIHAILKATSNVQVKACVYLGLNCGFGNTDCATLTKSALDLNRGWIDLPRPKTGIERRVPLWAETVDALREAMTLKRTAADSSHDDLVFLTREGMPLVWDHIDDAGKYHAMNNLSLTFGRLLRKTGVHKSGHNFYSLRRTFETVASGSKDQVAVDLIMGHDDSSMASVYRQGIDDVRLVEVVEYVRAWLFAE